jgi:hypothetical protein
MKFSFPGLTPGLWILGRDDRMGLKNIISERGHVICHGIFNNVDSMAISRLPAILSRLEKLEKVRERAITVLEGGGCPSPDCEGICPCSRHCDNGNLQEALTACGDHP